MVSLASSEVLLPTFPMYATLKMTKTHNYNNNKNNNNTTSVSLQHDPAAGLFYFAVQYAQRSYNLKYKFFMIGKSWKLGKLFKVMGQMNQMVDYFETHVLALSFYCQT